MSEVLPWHAPVLERLVELRDAGRLPNAIALTCAPGWGLETLLSQAAFTLLERGPVSPVEEFAHPDFRWLMPEGAVIKIDQVRRLNEFAVQTAQTAPRKVAALVHAHLLNEQAANALLKTLEEPPPNTHLLLGTSHWGKLLPTVRSRCQRMQAAPDPQRARSWLRDQGLTLTDEEFAESGHAPLTALTLCGEGVGDLGEWLTSLGHTPLAKAVDPVLDGDVVAWLSRWYRRLALHLNDAPVPGCDASPAALMAFADELLAIRRQIETTNSANARLLVERLVVRWLQIQPSGRTAAR